MALACHYLASVLFLAVVQLLWPVLVMLVPAPCGGPHHGREGDTCSDPRSHLDVDAGADVYKEQGCSWGDSEARGSCAELLVQTIWDSVPSGYYFKAVDSTPLEARGALPPLGAQFCTFSRHNSKIL